MNDYVQARYYSPEHRVTTVEMRRRHERHEELTAAAVGPRVRHADRAALERHAVDLVAQEDAAVAPAVATRVEALRDEARHDAMDRQPVALPESHAREQH